MKRRTKQAVALFGCAAVVTLAWPGPSSAETSLGGYSGTAQAAAIRIQIFEPTIPIPSTPQIDGSIAYTKSSTDTGPVSRATASYLWPGDVIGDGFNQLVGGDAKYPVQVNSRFPATSDAPATNTAQLTDGNGMTTSSNDGVTKASVTGLGIAGPGTDLLGGLGTGLGSLLGGPKTKPLPAFPVPVSSTLAGLATLQNVKSESDVVVGSKSVTSSAHTVASDLKLLGGLISITGADISAQTVSDGTKATTSGSVKAAAITIAGQELGLDDQGLDIAGTSVKLPAVPAAVTSLLAKIGVSVHYATTKRTVDGATGSLASTGLTISIDTEPLKTALNLGGIVGPLQDLIEKIPNLGSQVGPLLGIGPKIVFFIGDVSTSTTAAPAFTGGGTGSGGGSTTGSTPGGGGSTGGGSTGGGSLGGSTVGGSTSTGTAPGGTIGGTGTTSTPAQSAAFDLPSLGAVPRFLILGGLVLAAALGWVLRTAGGFILGTGRSCAYGLSTGVPDLRKG